MELHVGDLTVDVGEPVLDQEVLEILGEGKNGTLATPYGTLKAAGEGTISSDGDKYHRTHYEGLLVYEGMDFMVYATELRGYLSFHVQAPHLTMEPLRMNLHQDLWDLARAKLEERRGEKLDATLKAIGEAEGENEDA